MAIRARQLHQHLIPGGMPVGVVDELEMIDVEQQQRHVALVPAAVAELGAELQVEALAVAGAGERVGDAGLEQLPE